MAFEFKRVVSLQSQVIGGTFTQYKIVIPADFVRLLGLSEGGSVKLTFVTGTGEVLMEKGD